MTSSVHSFGNLCMQSFPVLVECIVTGLTNSSFDVVGLPDAAVRESRERVRAACENLGFLFPSGRITVNLSPADTQKEGAVYDLPILLAVLIASDQFDYDISDAAFLGEITLGGDVLPVRGVLPMALEAKKKGIKRLFVPFGNAAEASVAEGPEIYPVKNIMQLLDCLSGREKINPVKMSDFHFDNSISSADFADVRGQEIVRRAVEVAAAGGHNLLMVGSPGSGKSMLAKRIPSILPDMTFDESLETTKIHSVAGTLPQGLPLITTRPFRSPHHTVSNAGLAGGGSTPRPGEISMAHKGVLFLDELPEFHKDTLDLMRQPLEDCKVTISRISGSVTYPAEFMLVCAMNPCKCGWYGDPSGRCSCSENAVQNYRSRISGPLLDRIDMIIQVPAVHYEDLRRRKEAEPSAAIKERVDFARRQQYRRFGEASGLCNARMGPQELREFCRLDEESNELMKMAYETFGLTARSYDRILKVARTIADLDDCDRIKSDHLAEAIRYRTINL